MMLLRQPSHSLKNADIFSKIHNPPPPPSHKIFFFSAKFRGNLAEKNKAICIIYFSFSQFPSFSSFLLSFAGSYVKDIYPLIKEEEGVNARREDILYWQCSKKSHVLDRQIDYMFLTNLALLRIHSISYFTIYFYQFYFFLHFLQR